MNQRQAFQLGPFAVLIVVVGCIEQVPESQDAPPFDNEETVAVSRDELWASNAGGYFPQPQIAVCFSPVRSSFVSGVKTWTAAASNDADYVSFRNDVVPIIDREYNHVPDSALTLTGLGLCANRATGASTGAIRIVVDLGSTDADGGVTTNTSGIFRQCAATPDNVPHADADNPPYDDYCDSESGFASNRESSVFLQANPNLPNFGDFQRWVLLHELGHALNFKHEHQRDDSTIDGNCDARTATASTQGITVYDPLSIMKYCRHVVELSPLDRLGLAITYPASLSEPPRLREVFWKGDGSAVALSGSTVRQSWLADGAGPAAFSQRPRWLSGTTTVIADELTLTGSGPRTISGSYIDLRNRSHTITPVTFDVSNGLFTAIAISII